MSREAKQSGFPSLVDMREMGLFPKDGRTLLLDGVGQVGTSLLSEFVTVLKKSGAGSEIFAIAIEDSRRRGEIEKAMPWEFFGRKRVFTNPKETVTAMHSREGGNLHTGIHFVSHDIGRPEVARETVFSYTKDRELFHIAAIVKPSNPIDKKSYERGVIDWPSERSGIPTVVIDNERMERVDKARGRSRWLSSKTAFLHGLAALVAGPRLFPEVNRYSCREVLEALTEHPYRQVGIGVSVRDAALIPVFHGFRHDLALNDLAERVGTTITNAFADDANISPYDRDENAPFDVVSVQIPLNFRHPYWGDPSFLPKMDERVREDAKENGIVIPEDVVYVYSWSPLLTEGQSATFVATRFFPAAQPATR